jgi:hypothetical protein
MQQDMLHHLRLLHLVSYVLLKSLFPTTELLYHLRQHIEFYAE